MRSASAVATLEPSGTVVAWGWNEYGQTNVPAGLTGVTAIAAGDYHNVALKDDGTVVGWSGYPDDYGAPPLTGVTAIAEGAEHSLALNPPGESRPGAGTGTGS